MRIFGKFLNTLKFEVSYKNKYVYFGLKIACSQNTNIKILEKSCFAENEIICCVVSLLTMFGLSK